MTNILAELRRRNVFRVAAAYLVVGWLVLQVVGVLEGAAGLPDWADGLALVMLVTGFPIVLFVAWAFELTPEGMRKTGPAEGAAGFRPLGPSDYVLIAAVLVVLIVGGLQFTQGRGTSEVVADTALSVGETEHARPAAASIAVLPFADLSPDGDQAYFGDGIAEEILNVLTRVDGLDVASRTSAFQFRGDALGIPAIADRLNVRHVVEGSVRKAGDTLRITAQLIDAEGDRHLWSDTFDRPLTTENIFAIQDEIATEIVRALSNTLGIEAPDVDVGADTANLDAYELFLRGQALYHSRSTTNIPEGIDALEQAVAADPEFARAWAALSAIYAVAPSWIGAPDGRDFHAEAMVAADRATALNPQLARPFAVRGLVERDRFNWVEALEQVNRAIAIDPASADAWYFRGSLWLSAGYFDAAAEDFEACLDRDPAYEICRKHLSFAELYRGNTDRALALYEAATIAGQSSTPLVMIPVYIARGNDAAARYNLAYFAALGDQPWLAEALEPYYFDLDASNETLLQLSRSLHIAHHGSMDGFFDPDFGYEQGIRSFSNHSVIWSPFEIDRFRPASREAFLAARRDVIVEMQLPGFWRQNGFPPQCEPVGDDDFACGWID